MKQLQINPEQVIKVEYTGVASILNPILYKDGDSFCCILGSDPQSGVFGRGQTPEIAIQDWDDHLKEYLIIARPSDEVVQFVNSVLSESRKPIKQILQSAGMESHIASIEDKETAQQVRDFYNQFKPRNR